MPSLTERTRRSLVLGVAVSALTITACGNDGTPPEPEPEIATIRVTVVNSAGTSTVDINTTGAQWVYTPGPVPLRANQVNQVSFRFLGADGQDEPVIVAERANLSLDLSNLATGWTFSPTGGSGATFTANITPTQPGTFIPVLELFHSEHGHNEVDHVINVTVTQ
jgi:hypothetical protein